VGRLLILLISLIGCGRVGFDAAGQAPIDATADGAPGSDAAMPSLADHLPCGQQMLLDTGNHLAHDTLVWVTSPAGEWLVGVEHESQDDHQIQRHALTATPAGLAAGAAQLMLSVDHVDAMRFEPVPGGGYVLGYTEFVLGTAAALQVTPAMVGQGVEPLGPLAQGNPALARAGGGGLAMIGLNASNAQVVGLNDNGLPSGATANLAAPAEGAQMPTLTALDTGLAAVWHSASSGKCRLAVLDSDLHITHGPVDMATTGGACSDAHVAWLPAVRRLVMVASDSTDNTVAGSVWDETLAPVVPSTRLASSAHWIRIVADGDGAWIAWVDGSTGQQLRYGRLGADGLLPRTSAGIGQLDSTLGHYHTLQQVGQNVVALWTDTTMNRTFSAMRVCF
jgi:hypothetical protein